VAVDESRLATVCGSLEGLLAEDNAEAGDLLAANAELLGAAFPRHFRQIADAVRAFDFAGGPRVPARGRRRTRGHPEMNRTPEKRTVLAVDDTPENLSLLSEVLKDEYRVRVANSGERALAILKAARPLTSCCSTS
jgi:hypothetical protein